VPVGNAVLECWHLRLYAELQQPYVRQRRVPRVVRHVPVGDAVFERWHLRLYAKLQRS
jgi:hypothetical protein